MEELQGHPGGAGDVSPYETEQYNRFGSYALTLNRLPEPLAP